MPDGGAVSFERDVLPIFEVTCFECHGPTGRAKGDLRLHDEDALFEADRVLWVVEPGDPDASFLIELVSLPPDDDEVMPPEPEDHLSDEQIEILRAWIEALPPRD